MIWYSCRKSVGGGAAAGMAGGCGGGAGAGAGAGAGRGVRKRLFLCRGVRKRLFLWISHGPNFLRLGAGRKVPEEAERGWGGGEIIIDGKCLRGHSVIRLRGLCAVEMNEKESTYAFRSTAAY